MLKRDREPCPTRKRQIDDNQVWFTEVLCMDYGWKVKLILRSSQGRDGRMNVRQGPSPIWVPLIAWHIALGSGNGWYILLLGAGSAQYQENFLEALWGSFHQTHWVKGLTGLPRPKSENPEQSSVSKTVQVFAPLCSSQQSRAVE